MIYSKF